MGRALLLRTSIVGGIALGLAKVLISCVDLDSLGSGPPDGAPPPIDASLPDVVVDPCSHDQPAATSDVSDGDDVLPTFVLALDTLTFDPAKVTPLDLDGVCTCETRPSTSFDGRASCTAATSNCDGDGGADNNFGAVVELSGPALSFDRAANKLIEGGHRTLLLQIEKYNGLANDPEVVVGTLVAAGIRSQGCPSSVLEPGATFWSVGRCGNDAWTLSPASGVASGSGIVPFARGTGYVRNHRLVVRLNDAALVPFYDGTPFGIRMPVITGDLVPLGEDLAPRDPGRAPTEREKRLFRIENGLLAGRILATDLLAALGAYLEPATNAPLCKSAAFEIIRARMCNAVDIQAKPATDDPSRSFDPSKPCDALSTAMGFVAIPALTSYISDAGPLPTGCESVDAATFRCP